MTQFRGVIANVGDTYESLRLYRLDRPGQYVQFKVGAGTLEEEAAQGGMLPVHWLDIEAEDFEEGFERGEDLEGVFADQVANDESFAQYVQARDPRDARKSEDGSAFRCCYSNVYH
jgi:hypothetical protein